MASLIRSGSGPATAPRVTKDRLTAGFTLVELMVVMLIIAILSAIAIPSYVSTMRAGKEAILREDLRVMRAAIINYTRDKGKAPQNLEDLVQAGYLHELPEDPMTRSRDWVPDSDPAYYDLYESDPGIVDVHSSSTETGSDEQTYSSW
jgi:general secretion pathway protein G